MIYVWELTVSENEPNGTGRAICDAIVIRPVFRCVIPECDPSEPAKRIYEPDWLEFTTPHRHDSGTPEKCQRYNVARDVGGGGRAGCSPDGFDRNATQWCRDDWVFEDPENTIGTEVRDHDRGITSAASDGTASSSLHNSVAPDSNNGLNPPPPSKLLKL